MEAVPRVEDVPSAAPADLVLVTLLVVAVFSVLTILVYAGLRSVRAQYVSSHPPGHTFPWPHDPADIRAALGAGARRARVRTNRPRSRAGADVRVAVVGGTGARQTVFAKRLRKAGYRVVTGSLDEAGAAGLAAAADDSNTEAAESADYVLYILD